MRHPLSLFTIALMTATAVVMGAIIFTNLPGAQAQDIFNPEQAALQVYEALPNFPKENQYKFRKRNQVAENNTLISRLIRYHTINKARAVQYRLDWKITMADYLGINEVISSRSYPSVRILKSNPMEADIAIIQALSRSERNQLIQAIVNLYDTSSETSSPEPKSSPSIPQQNSAPSESATDLL